MHVCIGTWTQYRGVFLARIAYTRPTEWMLHTLHLAEFYAATENHREEVVFGCMLGFIPQLLEMRGAGDDVFGCHRALIASQCWSYAACDFEAFIDHGAYGRSRRSAQPRRIQEQGVLRALGPDSESGSVLCGFYRTWESLVCISQSFCLHCPQCDSCRHCHNFQGRCTATCSVSPIGASKLAFHGAGPSIPKEFDWLVIS